jgi:Ferritin-like domain
MLGRREGESRRSFLLRSAMTSAVGIPGLILAGSSASEAAFRPQIHLPELYPGWNRRNFHEILNDEAAHVAIIQELLMDDDNPLMPKVRARPTLKNLVQPNVLAFVQGAVAFENTGTGTYAGALFAIQQTEEYFPLAAGITTVEARHAGFLNTLLNMAIVPNFFPSDTPIPQSVALSHVDPFIADLNGEVPSFDPLHASDPNNFAILDFLLLLEYVETAYYQVNVRRFFG